MTKVYLVQEALKRDPTSQRLVSRIPIENCQRYGEVHYVFAWSALRRFGMTVAQAETDMLVAMARAALKDFTEEDFLVPVGNPVLIGIATLVAAEITNGYVKLLDWMRQEGDYRTFAVDCDWYPYAEETSPPVESVEMQDMSVPNGLGGSSILQKPKRTHWSAG